MLRWSLALIAAFVLAGRVEATTITWNTCEGPGSGGECRTGVIESAHPSVGDAGPFTFTATGGQVLFVDAFKASSPISDTPIRLFSGGIGAGGEDPPQHAVDNMDPLGNEIIVFKFPAIYKPLTFTLGYISGDSDLQTWIGGSTSTSLDFLLGSDWGGSGGGADSSLLSGFVYQSFDFAGNQATVPRTLTFSNNASGAILIIAAVTGGGDEDDKFKIQQIVADPVAGVPEPGSLILLGSGLAALALRRKR